MNEGIEYIDHQGKVTSINLGKSTVTVSLIEDSDCGGCPAGKLCSNFTPDKNVMEVWTPNAKEFEPGDLVIVRGTERLHRKALMLATIIPSIVLLVVMIGIYLLTWSQLVACLSGIGVMIAFFVGLYLMRHKLAHEFLFEVIKEKTGKWHS